MEFRKRAKDQRRFERVVEGRASELGINRTPSRATLQSPQQRSNVTRQNSFCDSPSQRSPMTRHNGKRKIFIVPHPSKKHKQHIFHNCRFIRNLQIIKMEYDPNRQMCNPCMSSADRATKAQFIQASPRRQNPKHSANPRAAGNSTRGASVSEITEVLKDLTMGGSIDIQANNTSNNSGEIATAIHALAQTDLNTLTVGTKNGVKK